MVYSGFILFVLVMVPVTLATLFIPFYYGVKFVIWTILISTVLMLFAAVRGVLQHDRDAWFYLLGNGIIWIYLWVQMLFYFGIVQLNVLPETLGLSCIDLSLFAFLLSMMQRIRLLRREKEDAQHTALELQRKLAHDLECLVAERTLSLERSKIAAERAQLKAEQADAAKTRFFSRVSHDLRAPVSWLIGLAQSLSMESEAVPELSGEFKECLSNLQERGGVSESAAQQYSGY